VARRRGQPLIRRVHGLVLVAACAVGCVRKPVYVHPADVRGQLPTLRREGHARVKTTPDGTHDLRTDQQIEVAIPERGLLDRAFDVEIGGVRIGKAATHRHRKLSVAELIAHCPDEAQLLAEHRGGACVLREVEQPFQVGTRLRPDGRAWGVVVVGLSYCAAECEEPWDVTSQITLGTVVVTAIILLGPLLR
jgi:hypothetical protein